MLKAGRLVHLCRGIIAANFRIKVPMQALYFADLDKKVVETRNPLMTVCVCQVALVAALACATLSVLCACRFALVVAQC